MSATTYFFPNIQMLVLSFKKCPECTPYILFIYVLNMKPVGASLSEKFKVSERCVRRKYQSRKTHSHVRIFHGGKLSQQGHYIPKSLVVAQCVSGFTLSSRCSHFFPVHRLASPVLLNFPWYTTALSEYDDLTKLPGMVSFQVCCRP
jgi:hypothetical protein